MGQNKNSVNETGIVKRQNKAKKNLAMTGVKPEEKGNPAWKPKPGAPVSPRVQAHKAKRGMKVKGAFNESHVANIVEGLVKKMNKAKKNAAVSQDGDLAKGRTNAKSGAPTTKTGEKHAALNMAGVLRRQGSKSGSKVWMKAAREAVLLRMKESIFKALGNTDRDTISQAGGDADVYSKMKAQKDRPEPTAKKRVTRTSAMGRQGGMYDKQGNPAKHATKGTSHFQKGQKQAPMPIDQINRAKSSGQEGAKADAHQRSFDILMQKLSKSRK